MSQRLQLALRVRRSCTLAKTRVRPASTVAAAEATPPPGRSSPSPAETHSSWAQPADWEKYKGLDLSFTDCKEAYRSKTTLDLWRALLVFRLCSLNWFVDNQKAIWDLSKKILPKAVLTWGAKSTFYGHFVAGEDVKGAQPKIDNNWKYGVKSILDYSVETDLSEKEAEEAEVAACKTEEQSVGEELSAGQLQRRFRVHRQFGDRRQGVTGARTYFYKDEEECDANMENFLQCIDAVANATRGTGFAAIKLTALGKPQFLMNMSELLVRMDSFYHKINETDPENDPDSHLKQIEERQFRKGLRALGIPVSRDDSKQWFTWLDKSGEGKIDLMEWSNLLNEDTRKIFALPSLRRFTDSLGQRSSVLEPLVPSMSEEDERRFTNMLQRINTLAEHATECDVRLMVDAEQTYFQPAINRLTIEMQRQFNKEKPIIFNTYQCYLKSTLNRIKVDLDLAKRENWHFACKIVRGAYMEQERQRADTIGYPDPIHPTFEATSDNYAAVLGEILRSAKTRPKGAVSAMLATHNEDSVRMAIEKMQEMGISPDDRILCFGQLMGMCDQVSFPLGQCGFSVYKYVPYGPCLEVMPYLMRRAQENQGIIKKVQKERALIWKEVQRRMLMKQ